MRKGQHCSEETKAKISAANKGEKLTPEQYERFCIAMRNRSLKTKQKSSESVKKLWEDPEYRKHMSEAHKGHRHTEEHRAKMSIGIRNKLLDDPGYREKLSASHKKRYQDPIERKKTSDSLKRVSEQPGDSERRRKRVIARWISPEAHDRQSEVLRRNRDIAPDRWHTKGGPEHPNWKGGISFEPYCPAFTKKLKEEIREKFGRKCYLCPKTEEENGRKLDVHHCDYNKGQGCGQRWSLIPLCHRCHIKTNFNRHYWFNLLSNYWALNPEINLF
jgi:hypothetical protein